MQNRGAEEISALIPASAIGATDPDEEMLVRQALAESTEAGQAAELELSQYISMTHKLMYGVPQLRPPSNLASQLQAAISKEDEKTPSAQRNVQQTAVAQRTSKSPTEERAEQGWLQQLFARWSWSYSAVAVALLLLVGLNLFSLARLQAVQQVQNELTAEISRHSAAMVMLTSEEVEELILPAVDESEEAFVSLFWHPEWDIAVIYAEEFPQLKPGMTYQLWLAADGQRVSGGIFDVNAVGNGTLILRPEQPIDTYSVIGITTEPEGGSPSPTSPPIVRLES